MNTSLWGRWEVIGSKGRRPRVLVMGGRTQMPPVRQTGSGPSPSPESAGPWVLNLQRPEL